ncbi:Retrovirus-related Pol polyprotein from transposon 17.6, partial [Mucuna pruriens]
MYQFLESHLESRCFRFYVCEDDLSYSCLLLLNELSWANESKSASNHIMNSAQLNYTTTEKKLLTIVFTLDKFHSYLLGSKIIIFSNHAALQFLLKKPDMKPKLIRWMLLLQEFDIEIKDKRGVENSVAYHIS